MHRPYNFYYEIPVPIQEYIITQSHVDDIREISLEKINDIFATLPEAEYLLLIAMERKAQKYLC